jgi:hypothetical protein
MARDFCDFLTANSSGIEFLIQTPHCPVITLVDADRATATTTIYELTRGRVTEEGNPFGPIGAELSMEDFGIYDDTLQRFDGEWLFTHRVFVPVWVDSSAVTGDVTSPRTTLRGLRAG